MRIVFSIFLIFGLATIGVAAEASRTFTAENGNSTVEAQLMEVVENARGQSLAVLRRNRDGVLLTVPISSLSKADQEYVAARKRYVTAPELAGRWTLERRLARLRAAGVDEASESAVSRSLAWLTQKQNADGSWGDLHPCAMTAFCLLAMSGHGETLDHPERGAVMRRGVEFLLKTAEGNRVPPTFAGVFSTKPKELSSTYEHAIATLALAEIMVADGTSPGAGPALEKALDRIVKSQGSKGLWGYKQGLGYAMDGGTDLSLSHWQVQVQALAMAEKVSANRTRLRPALNKAGAAFVQRRVPGQGFGRSDKEGHYNQWGLTGSSAWALRLTGLPTRNVDTASAVDWLLNQEKTSGASWDQDCQLYAWLFNACAFYQSGGPAWTWWRETRLPQIPAAQLPDGSFRAEQCGPMRAGGSAAAGSDAGLYRTCLAALMLEVPYRYDPD